jgi:isocitrate/isopropylmalate dehydrogenase
MSAFLSSHDAYCVVVSLDSIANNIAAATYAVINEKQVRTADMGGKLNKTHIKAHN